MKLAIAQLNKGAYLFLTGTFISYLGNGIQTIASAYLTFVETDSVLAIGQLFILIAIPEALVSSYFGGLVDKFNRKWLCVWTDIGRGGVALLLPMFLMLGVKGVWIIYLTNFLIALGDAIFTPASNALAQEIVPEKKYRSFSIAYEVVLQAGTLLSVAAGGLLSDWLGVSLVLLLNSLTYFISGILHGFIPYRFSSSRSLAASVKRSNPRASWRTFYEGLEPYFRRTSLIGFGCLFALVSVIITACNTLLIPLVIRQNQDSLAVLGLTDAFSGIGMVFAGLFFSIAVRSVGEYWIVFVGYLVCAIFLILIPYGGTIWVMACTTPSAISFGLARIGLRSLIFQTIPNEVAGRFFGFFNAIGLLSAAVVAFYASQGTVQSGYLLIALVVITVTCLGFCLILRERFMFKG